MARYVIFNGVRTRYEDDGSQSTQDAPLAHHFDYDANGNLLYEGKAQAGTLATAPAWQIKSYVWDVAGNLTDVLYAGSSPEFVSAWTDRASLTYG